VADEYPWNELQLRGGAGLGDRGGPKFGEHRQARQPIAISSKDREGGSRLFVAAEKSFLNFPDVAAAESQSSAPL